MMKKRLNLDYNSHINTSHDLYSHEEHVNISQYLSNAPNPILSPSRNQNFSVQPINSYDTSDRQYSLSRKINKLKDGAFYNINSVDPRSFPQSALSQYQAGKTTNYGVQKNHFDKTGRYAGPLLAQGKGTGFQEPNVATMRTQNMRMSLPDQNPAFTNRLFSKESVSGLINAG